MANGFLSALGLVLGLPVLLSCAVAFVPPVSRLDWLLSALLCAGVSIYMHLAGSIWVWIGVDWRFLPLATTISAVLWSARRLRARPVLPSARLLLLSATALRCSMVALFAGMLVNLQIASSVPAGAVDLSFPLAGGRFAVVQGGGAAALNHHHVVPAQAYAIDIVALNNRGRARARLAARGARRLRSL